MFTQTKVRSHFPSFLPVVFFWQPKVGITKNSELLTNGETRVILVIIVATESKHKGPILPNSVYVQYPGNEKLCI